jgi:poly(3-hydroxybutyrate) depolymerase
VGVELCDLIAAIGDVSGSLFQGNVGSIPPARAPVSVLILHGDADFYCGGGLDASQDQTFDYWAGGQADSCSSIDPTVSLRSTGQHDCSRYQAGAKLQRGGITTNDVIWNFFDAHPKR